MTCLEQTLAGIDGGHLLDVGCGAGRFTRQLADELRSVASIIGIDPNKDSIDEARRETDDRRITYRIISGEEMTFSDGRFDTVGMSHALHHLDDPDGVLAQIVRVLRPGGLLILHEPVSDVVSQAQENGRDIHHFKATIDRIKGLSHRATYSADEVRRIAGAPGLEPVVECVDDRSEAGAEARDAPSDDEPAREATEFISEYLGHIKDREEYYDLAKDLQTLNARIVEHGVDSVPTILIVLRKPEDRLSPRLHE